MSQVGQAGEISRRFASAGSGPLHSNTSVSAARAAEIRSKYERVSERAQSHFEKHRQLWTTRQFGELLARDGPRMTLRPPGMPDDRKAHLSRAADSMVLHRQARRMAKLERAATNILGNTKRGSEK